MRFAAEVRIAQVLLVAAAGSVAAVMPATLRGGADAAREIGDPYEQTLTVAAIAEATDDDSEPLAELFILGLGARKVAAARAALLDVRDGLEREVAARAEELSRAVEALEARSAGRARFPADISREPRAPLTVLRGRAEVTLHDPAADAPAMRAAPERIVGEAEDPLFLARGGAGAVPIRRDRVVLRDVPADALLDARDLAGPEAVRPSPREPAEPLVATGDADRRRQAVLIPIDDAVRAAPAGGVIRVAPGRDGGPGFVAEEIEDALRRFHRGRTGGVAGLGMSIALDHGGPPRHHPARRRRGRRRGRAPRGAAGGRRVTGARILLVEDDPESDRGGRPA